MNVGGLLLKERTSLDRIEKDKVKRETKTAEQRAKFLYDPLKAEKMVASLMTQHVPEGVKVKSRSSLGPLQSVSKAIPEGDPRKELGQTILDEYNRMLSDERLTSFKPEELILASYTKNIRNNEEAIRQHAWDRKEGWHVIPRFKSGVRELPGQEEWEQKEFRPGYTSAVGAATIGGGFSAALMGSHMGVKLAARKLFPKVAAKGAATFLGRRMMRTPGFVPKLVGATLMAVPSFAAFDFTKNRIEQTQWAKDNPIKALGLEMAISGGALYGGAKAFKGVFPGATSKLKAMMKGLQENSYSKEVIAEAVKRDPKATMLLTWNKAHRQEEKVAEEYAKKLGEGRLDVAKTLDNLVKKKRVGIAEKEFVKQEELYKARTAKPTPKETTDILASGTNKSSNEMLDLMSPKSFDKIENTDRIFTKIKQGKDPATAVIETSAEEKLVESTFKIQEDIIAAINKIKPVAVKTKKSQGIGNKTKESLTELGYKDDDFKDMTYQAARSLIRAEKDKAQVVKMENKVTDAVKLISGKESTFDFSAMTPNDKVKALLKMKPNERLDLYEAGQVTRGEWREVVRTVRKDVESKEAYKAYNKELDVAAKEVSDVEIASIAEVVSTTATEEQVKVLDRIGMMKVAKAKKDLEKLGVTTKEGLDKATEVTIPKLSNTTEAVTFGRVASKEQVELLKAKRQELLDEVVLLGKDKTVDTLQKRGNLATEAQMYREAIESSEGEEYLADIVSDTGFLDKLKNGLLAAGSLIVLSDVLGPEDAEAGMVDQVAGRTLTKLTASIIKNTPKKSVTNLIKSMEGAGLLPKEGTKFFLGEPMRQLKIIPDISSIARRAILHPAIQSLASPYRVAHHYFGVSKEGLETMTNPMVQWASGQTAAMYNSKEGLRVLRNILDDVPNYQSSIGEVRQSMKPMIDEFFVPMQQRSYHQYSAKHFRSLADKELNKITKGKKYRKKTEDAAIATAEALENKALFHEQAFSDTNSMFKSYTKTWDKTIKPLAAQHSGVRMFLAAEDTAKFESYPFLEGMLSFEEKLAVSRIKEMMEIYGVRTAEAGHKIITKRPYMHHAAHPDADFKRAENVVTEGNLFKDYPPPMAKLHSRVAGYKPMMPDMEYSVQKYLPDINMRLEVSDFWRMGRADGWHAFKQSDFVQKNSGMRKFFEAMEDGFKPQYKEGVDKAMERFYAVEVMRLLSFSPSVTFKHYLKTVADLRIFGWEGAKVYPKAIGSFSRLELERAGGKEALKKAGISLTVEDEAVKAMNEQGSLWRTISDATPFSMADSKWDKVVEKINKYGGAPVAWIERFDRGFSTLCALKMASKKGMTPAQAAYGVYDTIIKTNFLSGNMNPSWLRNPKIRLMMMFQGTPFKIFEQRLLTYGRAGKAVGRAGKVTLEQLRNLSRDVKEGEHAFKWELIKGALNSEKDLFGTPVTRQVMREVLTVGGIVGLGEKVLDVDLLHHFIHPPFIKADSRDIAVSASPIVQASWRTWKQKDEEDRDFILSTFFQEWFGRANKGVPVPVNLNKALRLSKGDIPEMYKESELKYLFGVPTPHHD